MNHPLIDRLKFIMAYLVMIIHFRPFMDVNADLDLFFSHGLSRLAVPFFLISAGYFLELTKIKESIHRYLRLYLTWTLYYLPFIFLGFSYSQASPFSKILTFLRDAFFQGTVLHLWYLPASIFAFWMVDVLKERISLKSMVILGFILMSIGVFADAYSGYILPNSIFYPIQQMYLELFASSRNGLFFAFFYISLGAYLKTHPSSFTFKQSVIGFLFFFGLMTVELFFIIEPKHPIDYNFYFSLVFAIYFLFNASLTSPLKLSKYDRNLRHMASSMYFSHNLIYYSFMFVLGFPNINSVERFLIAASLTTIVTFYFELRKGKKHEKNLSV